MRDVLLTGKVKEAVTRSAKRDKNKLIYDAVVLDAPPTGRITRFLNVTSEVRELARSGPVRGQAESVIALLKSKQTAVHIVTILEEMPVQETVDGVAELQKADLPVGAVIVNMARTPLLDDAGQKAALTGHLDAGEIAAGLKRASFKVSEGQVAAMITEARQHAERVALEAREREDLAGLGVPVYELPLLTDAVDLGGLYRLAEGLRGEGMAG
jgi:anion-transporting  ArsA/GET3 family ATPase